jgi:type III pantothenate kinase
VYQLAVDVGNTKTAMGLFEMGRLVAQWRVRTAHWTPDELWVLVCSLFQASGAPMPSVVAYACVVPQVTHALVGFSRRWINTEPIEVNHETAGIALDYPNPSELGPDRLANAAGALLLKVPPLIVADFGTATTFDVIDARGRYVGGSILPGVGTAASELFKKAEKISPVDLEFPDSPLGRSTVEAVRSGVLHGAVGSADRLTELLSGLVEGEPSFLATGGWAASICPRCRFPFVVCPELTLMGIDWIGRKRRSGNG